VAFGIVFVVMGGFIAFVVGSGPVPRVAAREVFVAGRVLAFAGAVPAFFAGVGFAVVAGVASAVFVDFAGVAAFVVFAAGAAVVLAAGAAVVLAAGAAVVFAAGAAPRFFAGAPDFTAGAAGVSARAFAPADPPRVAAGFRTARSVRGSGSAAASPVLREPRPPSTRASFVAMPVRSAICPAP
jgi:hypothetical protein